MGYQIYIGLGTLYLLVVASTDSMVRDANEVPFRTQQKNYIHSIGYIGGISS
jgi:hypothetical protein